MNWSHYSTAIFDAYQQRDSNLIVQACPGAGKTTNIMELWKLDNRPTVYLVFNKQNQIEAEGKMPVKAGSQVLTTHSLGYRALRNTYGDVRIDDKKVMQLIRSTGLVKKHFRSVKSKLFARESDVEWCLKKAVDVAKFYCLDDTCSEKQVYDMAAQFDMLTYEGMADHISRILQLNDDEYERVDFSDMIRLPALYQCSMPQYVNVLCDEVQDFNPMQALLVGKLQAERYAFVGDRRQSIYGFRGAMLDSMDYLKEQFNCVELPLSISYRCPQLVIAEAARIWPDIEAWDESPQGEVRTLSLSDENTVTEIRSIKSAKDGLILCRNNKPLVQYAYELLRQGIACHVRGRAIGQGLVNLVNKFEVATVADLITCLQEWYELETAKAQAAEDEHKASLVEDKYSSLMVMVGKCGLNDHPSKVVDEIDRVFDEGKGVTLSTVHKAKGLEARSVYLLENQLFATAQSRARKAWQSEQERNVQYVAVTRAQERLTYS